MDLGQQLEQLEASLRAMIVLFATYYKALIENGMPDDLARQLTRDFHQQYTETMLNYRKANQ
jgi:hypothetical protein